MKTHRELSLEAERIEQVGRRYWDEHRTGGGLSPLVVFRFPVVEVTEPAAGGRNFGPSETHRLVRIIEVDLGKSQPEYALIEEDLLAEPMEGLESLGATPLAKSESVLPLLTEGYQMGEEDRLREALAPFAERIEVNSLVESVDPLFVQELELVIGAGDLAPGARMRARADIVEFLEGRLEPSDFITAAIERHGQRETEREAIVTRHGERLVLDPP